MSHWSSLRQQARERRHTLIETVGGEPSPAALLAAAAEAVSLRIKGKPSGHPLLAGGAGRLDLDNGAIWYDRDVEPARALFIQAHELAHFWLHRASFACTAQQIDPEAGEGDDFGADRAEAYSPRERLEREANVFAREFLLPGDELERRFVGDGQPASAIAEATGFPERVVLHQLSRALLTVEAEAEAPRPLPALDASQRAAAHAERGPVLVEAGPGTGKTTALIGRIAHLLDQGVAPDRILALTFSRKAAEEMRARLARTRPEAAAALWMDTFHAFGLELLRKHGPWPDPEVIDPVDALALLEDHLGELDLRHFQDLARPAEGLKPVLDAIARAKDERVDPARFRALAEAQHARAQEALAAADEKGQAAAQKALLEAEKALEAAGVYARYQAHLQARGAYDFGDLVHQAAALLEGDATAREAVRARFTHVLVDEAQDLNHASAVLLQHVAGDGAGLWAVGDLRQAIYRFRGASTEVVRRFLDDYPGACVVPLETNYRSQRPILAVVRALAEGMTAQGPGGFTAWTPHRTATNGRVQMEVAGSPEAELEGLVREIQLQQRAGGLAYRDQVVLGRTYSQLAGVAAALEAAGVPTLFLGAFFEREEVRDLLALLELATGGRHALLRVGAFDEYAVPLDDVRALLRAAEERAVRFPQALALAAELEGLSDAGRQGMQRLHGHLRALDGERSAWGFLTGYLFNVSRYLDPLLRDPSARAQQRRAALYQLLLFAYSRAGGAGDGRRAFLRRVRRMVIQSDDRQLWQVPDWAQGIDAVRLLTVHAAKGLEFRAVYVPNLVKRRFPLSWNGDRRPLPEGVLRSDPKADHLEEEECLLFVAASRARDLLVLTRAQAGYYHRLGKPTNSAPPDLLDRITGALPHSPKGAVTWPGEPLVLEDPAVPVPEHAPEFDVRELEAYGRCPRAYYYRYVLRLDAPDEVVPYLRFHRAARAAVRWALAQRQAGAVPDEAAVLAKLEEAWAEAGPKDEHAFSPAYRQEAERMARQAVARIAAQAGGRGERPEWTVERPHGRVRLRPDHVEVTRGPDGPTAVVQRWRTGRISSSELQRPRYALLAAAAATSYPAGRFRVETVSLASDAVEEPPLKGNGSDAFDGAIRGILRGAFDPAPDAFRCPHCRFFFACPAGDQ